MSEPREFVAGDTVSWRVRVAGYSPDDGWGLVYYFWNESADFSVIGVVDGGEWVMYIPASVSAACVPGRYRWQRVFARGVGEELERVTGVEGVMVVRHNPAAGKGTGIDSRSEVKRALDAIDAVLARSATKEQASYSIDGRALQRRSAEELLVLRGHYARLYAKELREERVAKGMGVKRVYTRFGKS